MSKDKNTNVGSVFFKISSNRGAFTKEMKSTASGVQSTFGSAMKAVGKSIGVAFSVGAVVSFGKKCVQVASETQSAWTGLSSIINGQGKDFNKANSFIQDYIKDGLVPLNNAVTAYKNLTARGYDQSQVKSVMNALKDSAAFGRQASLSYGDAIQSATEGLKNENSVLVDNAGVTKNVAKMWEDYAKSIGTTSAALTQQQKIQAEVNGILQETRWQTGDAAKYSHTFAGGMARITATSTQLKTAIGNMLIPVLNQCLPLIQTGLDLALSFCNAMQSVMASLGWEMPDVSDFSSAIGSVSTDAVNAATATEGIGKAAETAAKKAKRAFASFDEINVLNTQKSDTASAGSSSGGVASSDVSSAVNGGVNATSNKLDELSKKLKNLWNGFSAGFEKEKKALFAQIDETKNRFKKVWTDLKSLGTPIKNWATNDLTEFFRTFCHTSANAFLGLWDTADIVFGDLWDNLVFPVAQKLVTNGLPLITQFKTESTKTFGNLFNSVKEIVDTVWTDGVVPALKFVSNVFSDVVDIISDKWKTYGAPIFESIRNVVENVKTQILGAWNGYIKPCWDTVMSTLDKIWSEHLKPLVDNIGSFVGEFIQAALDIYNEFVHPVVMYLQQEFNPKVVSAFENISNVLSPIISGIIDVLSGITTTLRGIVQFVAGVFTDDWKRAWEGVKTTFKGVWDTLSSVIKTPINAMLAMFENFINRIVDGINNLIRRFNSISWNVPDWIPGIGGNRLGFNIPQVARVSLPRLAEGGWVAANNPQLAIIGDNRREGEIVTPESKIREQVEAALAKFGTAAQKIKLELEILIKYPDGRTIIKRINEAQVAEGRILLEV